MVAMIFAAGLGTRLRPLTLDRPKALVELEGKSLLEITIQKLIRFGFGPIVINVHHFADKVETFVKSKNWETSIYISDERGQLLETGGGLQHAAHLLGNKSFLVHNVDILTDLDLHHFYRWHLEQHSLVSLAIRERESSRKLLFDQDLHLCGWRNQKTGETRWARQQEQVKAFAFSGIHVIDPKIFSLMSRSGKFSIIETYLSLAASEKIGGFDHSDGRWMDVGKYQDMDAAIALNRKLIS